MNEITTNESITKNGDEVRAISSSSAVPATGKRPEGKMQQLLALARERLHEQQKALIERDATIRELRAELLEAQAAPSPMSGKSSSRIRRMGSQDAINQNEFIVEQVTEEEAPIRAWCHVDERMLGLSSNGRWVLFEWDMHDDISSQNHRFLWRRFKDLARLEDYVRRDPGCEPLVLPEPLLTVAEGRDIRNKAEVAVAQTNDELKKIRVQAELQRKRRDELDRENRQVRRELLRLQSLINTSNQQEEDDINIVALQDRVSILETENSKLKRQLETKNADHSRLSTNLPIHHPAVSTQKEISISNAPSSSSENNNENYAQSSTNDTYQMKDTSNMDEQHTLPPSPAAADAALAAQWRQRYEGVVAQRDKLASQLKSLSAADANSSEYAALNREFQDLQREYKQYRSNALKAMRLQEQQMKAAEQKIEKKALNALGNRDNGASNEVTQQEARPLSPDDAKAKLQYLKNLMAKYLATAQAQPREHMERAIVMVLNFSDDEKAAIAQQHRAGSAVTSSTSGISFFS
eukprot:CAMPEP_0197295986 /NCGR_PEP_ID=MMETSP0890-20130614/37206_1 /TAXON_ID=44058 ORGANISM="Aureoumbra lagunensis, Strain CCMP1510" /NCGR_SAMPLE_ID=MMETSP0890 /ASSEMBLY_ACC=CAM_ASM_000533 /LENGTH=522 /DNA_ID=CAMNT_0042772285 /DNA_START=17 /DNA_END=1585 /DNA_ORIENTATION=-